MNLRWIRRSLAGAARLAGLSLFALAAARVTRAAEPGPGGARPALRRVTFLHMADSHAQLDTHVEYMPGEDPPFAWMGGYARLKSAIDEERRRATGPVFLADGGDTFQGSAAAAWSRGEAVVGPLNALGLDVFVPGNWEVVYGPDQFRHLMGELSGKVIAYNLHDAATGRRLYPPSVTLDRGGVRVAFVGLPDPTTTRRQPPEEVRGLDSTRIGGLREFVQELRRRDRPDLVVAVTHTGLTVSRQIAREVPGFDIILSGHTHERTYAPIHEGKVLLVEPGSMGSFLGRLEVDVGRDGGVARSRFELIPIRASRYDEDPRVAEQVRRAEAPFRARADRVVGRTETLILRYDVLETSADDLVSDAVREVSGADIGSTNGFRFTPPIPPGPVTEEQLWNLLPLDARMKMGWVTGRELRRYLENELELVFSKDAWKLSGGWGPRLSGVEMRFAAHGAPGHRIVQLRVRGRDVRDEDRFTFAGCERAGEPIDVICRLAGVHDARVLEPSIHQALDAYFARHGTVSPRPDGREVAVDLPPQVFSQDAVLSSAVEQRPLESR